MGSSINTIFALSLQQFVNAIALRVRFAYCDQTIFKAVLEAILLFTLFT